MHHITICQYCAVVIEQCRCPDKNKTVIYDTCESCKRNREIIV